MQVTFLPNNQGCHTAGICWQECRGVGTHCTVSIAASYLSSAYAQNAWMQPAGFQEICFPSAPTLTTEP